METEWINLAVVLGGIGIGMLLLGISVRSGKFKSWWLAQFNPVVPEIAAYIGIPGSITFFLLALAALMPDLEDRQRLFDLSIILLIVAIVIALWRPRWLLPKWLRWLQAHHKDILPLLKQEAQAMPDREWNKRVETQEDLEQWVAEVRRKHGL
jgi:NhaP-type Na+/H+ and K+/H+ antiporter